MAKLNSGTRIYGNVTVDTFVTATGNVIAGNVTTVGLVSATGNITGGNVLTAGLMSSTGNAIHGNILTAGLISATGTITGSSHLGAVVSVTGNATSGNTITSRVVISANSAVNTLVSVTDTAPQGTSSAFSVINSGNTISILSNISAGSFNGLQSNGDIAILTTGPTIGNVGFSIIPWSGTTSGIKMNTVANVTTITLAAATLSTTGNITGGIGNITIGNVLTAGIVSATGNIQGGNLRTVGLLSATGNVIGGNILTTGLISATGNITGNYFIGNGSQLTGVIGENVVLNDISNQFDNIKSVFALTNEQANVTNVGDSRNLRVVVGGQTLSPYVTLANWPFVGPFFTPYDSYRGFRVKSNSVSSNLIIYNSPAIGDQASITITNNSTTVQTRRYPYSPETIAIGD